MHHRLADEFCLSAQADIPWGVSSSAEK